MDQGADRVKGNGVSGGGQQGRDDGRDQKALAPVAEAEVEELERQIGDIRGNLTVLVDELQRRRHEAFDVRLQLRRHPAVIGGVALGLAGGITLLVLALVRRHRRRQSISDRLRRLRRGLAYLIDDPDGSTGRERPWRRAAAAGGKAAASQLGRRLVGRLLP
jgi:hypothetical protein